MGRGELLTLPSHTTPDKSGSATRHAGLLQRRTSAPGGSQSLSGPATGVMNVHPQFFYRYKTLILEPLIGHVAIVGGHP